MTGRRAPSPWFARLDVTGIPPREITLARHADRTLTPAALAFVDVVREVADDLRQYAARR